MPTKPVRRTVIPAPLITAFSFSEPLVEAIEQLELASRRLRSEIAKAQRSGAVPLARAYLALYLLEKQVEDTLKPIGQTYDQTKTQWIPESFESEHITSVPLTDGYRIGVSSRLWASIKSDDKGGDRKAAFAWLRKNGLQDLIAETVNASSLSAAAKAMMEGENKELPSDLFNTTMVPNTSVNRTKG